MALHNLPSPIAAFLNATRQRDSVALQSLFTSGAVVEDGDCKWHGESIKSWSDRHCLGAQGSVRPVNMTRSGNRVVLTVLVDAVNSETTGTGTRQLDWVFTLEEGRIAELSIVQTKMPVMPSVVAAFVNAINAFDLESLMVTFVDDALVNDQLREYWGKSSIRDWAVREVIGDRLTMFVVRVLEHYGSHIVTANVDGDYDKRGLPDPLVITFYFSTVGDKVAQLIILRNFPNM